MAKEVPSVSEEDFAEVADLAEETPTPVEIAVEELDVVEESAEIFSVVDVEEDVLATQPSPEVSVEVPEVPEVQRTIANPDRIRAGEGGGIVAARSARRP